MKAKGPLVQRHIAQLPCYAKCIITNKVHAVAAAKIRALQDPNLVAETSYLINHIPHVPYGTVGSCRLDALENTIPSTVCVYDYKTGDRGLRPRRAVDIGYMVKKNFPHAKHVILIEVRPQQ